MSNTVIKIKNTGSTGGAPTSPALALGEFAYSYLNGSQSNGGDRLYIGTGGETDGVANSVSVIGGKYFTDMLDHVHGTLTADSAIITDSSSKIDVLNVDNLTLDGNTLSSTNTNGDVILDPNGTGTIVLNGPVSMTGDFGLTGDLSVTNLDVSTEATLASAVVEDLTDNRIVIVGTGGIIEDDSNFTFDGTTFKVGTDTTDKFTVAVGTGNTFIKGTLETDGQATLASLNVEDLTSGRVIFAGTNGELVDSLNFTFNTSTNNLVLTGDQDITGSLDVDAVNIDGSTISTTTTNTNLTIAPNGTGGVVITSSSALTIPSGTNAERPTGVDGMIRFNETSSSFEGYHNLNWNSLGGVKDVDGDTYILAETSPGADNDDLEFYTAGVKRANLDATGFVIDATNGGYFQVGKIKIDDDTISSLSGGVIYIDPNPAGSAGSVVIEGDLTVNGTTTTVNSTVVTIDDAIFTLGGDTTPTTNDGLDKGISFQWYDTSAHEGFFGWDLNDSKFKFIPDATFTSGVVSGSLGDVAFANGLLTSLSFDGTGTGYAQNGVMYTNTSNDVVYASSSTQGHVLQIDASGVPYFGIIEGGTY